jgi:N-acetylglucosamine kinase-like BadF-type ATPase
MVMGFDGGGSKTECVVLDDEGNTVARGAAGPSNPLRVGFQAAFQELARAAAAALASAHLKPRQIRAVCAGLAGAGQRAVVRKTMLFLAHEFPDALAHVTTDGDVALEAAVGASAGVVLIAGTGSAACGRNSAGETARAGGFGRWIGDDGSAYEIGRRAMFALARARDQGSAPSLLGERIAAALDGLAWEQIIERVATNPDDVFPKIFPAVAAAAEAQDGSAQEILFSSAVGLSSMALTVVRRLRLEKEEFVMAKSGGVFGVSPFLDSMLDALVASVAPRAQLVRLETSPARGAAQIAARLAGEDSRAAAGESAAPGVHS